MKSPSILFLIIVFSVRALAQDTADQLRERYTVTYTTLLESESTAADLARDLHVYAEKTPYSYEVVLSTVQRILVQRLTPKARRSLSVMRIIAPCGDAAVAVDGGDHEFTEVSLIISEMLYSQGTTNYVSLSRLEAMGLPVFRFVAVGINRPVETVKTMSYSGRLKTNVVAELLLQSFTQSYGGMAEKKKAAR